MQDGKSEIRWTVLTPRQPFEPDATALERRLASYLETGRTDASQIYQGTYLEARSAVVLLIFQAVGCGALVR